MNKTFFPVFLLLIATLSSFVHAQQSTSGEDQVSPLQVRQILMEHCAQCHGKDIQPMAGFFGPIENLQMLHDERWITPGDSDQSSLLRYIHPKTGTMPPRGSGVDKLSDEQYQHVLNWIQQGASVNLDPNAPINRNAVKDEARDTTAVNPYTDNQSMIEENSTRKSSSDRWRYFIGKFHVLLVHFPIALLLMAFLSELFYLLFKKQWLRGAVRFNLIFGGIGALFAVTTGYFLQDFLTTSANLDLIKQHEHFALASLFMAAVTIVFSELREVREKVCDETDQPVGFKPGLWSWLTRIGLIIMTGLIFWTGHLGGTLSRGEDYLQF